MFTVSADKQSKERILGEKMFSLRTETEPKPWPKNRGTDRTVGYRGLPLHPNRHTSKHHEKRVEDSDSQTGL